LAAIFVNRQVVLHLVGRRELEFKVSSSGEFLPQVHDGQFASQLLLNVPDYWIYSRHHCTIAEYNDDEQKGRQRGRHTGQPRGE
jgi:hypothetical protein